MTEKIYLQNISKTVLKHQFFICLILLLINSRTIEAQPCTVFPGYTTWLGYSDDWDDSSNWCPAIAPVSANPAMNVRIPGGPSGFYTYYRPVIKSGVSALTLNLRIESADTLFIQGTSQSSLVVNDSLKIESSTSALIVNNISSMYPIIIGGHWENNGVFVAGHSRVRFEGTINDQQIGGQSVSTFFELQISNPFHVLLLKDFVVEESLRIISGHLKLNLGIVTILNSNPAAITHISGGIQAEMDLFAPNVFPFGRLNWKMGSIPGLRIIPFINPGGIRIELSYDIISGFHDVIFGTYGTYPNNTNLPLPEVTNVYDYTFGTIDSSGNTLVNRFYLLNNWMGINPVANVVFRYAVSERANICNTNMRAQRWLNSTDIWENPVLPGQTHNTTPVDNVNLTISDSVFATSEWWNISCFPLGTGLSDADRAIKSVFPNPAFSGETLHFVLNDLDFSPEEIQMITVEGREVLNVKFERGTNTIQIPVNLSPGVYTLILRNSTQSGFVKLVVMNR